MPAVSSNTMPSLKPDSWDDSPAEVVAIASRTHSAAASGASKQRTLETVSKKDSGQNQPMITPVSSQPGQVVVTTTDVTPVSKNDSGQLPEPMITPAPSHSQPVEDVSKVTTTATKPSNLEVTPGIDKPQGVVVSSGSISTSPLDDVVQLWINEAKFTSTRNFRSAVCKCFDMGYKNKDVAGHIRLTVSEPPPPGTKMYQEEEYKKIYSRIKYIKGYVWKKSQVNNTSIKPNQSGDVEGLLSSMNKLDINKENESQEVTDYPYITAKAFSSFAFS